MKTTTAGIDLAKNVIQVHGVDRNGRAVWSSPTPEQTMLAFSGCSRSISTNKTYI